MTTLTCPEIRTPGGAVRPAHAMRAVTVDGVRTWACTRCGSIEPAEVDLSWCSVRPARDPGRPTQWINDLDCNCVTCRAYLGLGDPE